MVGLVVRIVLMEVKMGIMGNKIYLLKINS